MTLIEDTYGFQITIRHRSPHPSTLTRINRAMGAYHDGRLPFAAPLPQSQRHSRLGSRDRIAGIHSLAGGSHLADPTLRRIHAPSLPHRLQHCLCRNWIVHRRLQPSPTRRLYRLRLADDDLDGDDRILGNRFSRRSMVLLPMKNRLRVLRAEQNWSQQELGMRVGVTRQAINAIENGKYDPGLPLAMKIARVFEQRVDDLFQLEDGD